MIANPKKISTFLSSYTLIGLMTKRVLARQKIPAVKYNGHIYNQSGKAPLYFLPKARYAARNNIETKHSRCPRKSSAFNCTRPMARIIIPLNASNVPITSTLLTFSRKNIHRKKGMTAGVELTMMLALATGINSTPIFQVMKWIPSNNPGKIERRTCLNP